jgi:hypothetical protein
MAWQDAVLIDGHDTILYAQAAGATATPGTANEVPYASAFSWGTEKQKTTRGPFINSSALRKSSGGRERTGSLTIELAAAADTVRELLVDAGNGDDRVKFTLLVGGASGDEHVWDDVILDFEGEVSPEEGITYTVPWEADEYVFTAGTFA